MSDSKEPSLRDYAHFHGVASDHRYPNPVQLVNDVVDQDSQSAAVNICSLDDDHRAQEVVKSVYSEKLLASRGCGELLSSIARLCNECKTSLNKTHLPIGLPYSHRVEQLKIDQPILRREAWREHYSLPPLPSLDGFNLRPPLEELRGENDEGLAFPSYYTGMSNEIQEGIAKEKIHCPASTLRCLQEIRKDQGQAAEGSLPYIKPKSIPPFNEDLDNYKLYPRDSINGDKRDDISSAEGSHMNRKSHQDTFILRWPAATTAPRQLLPPSFSAGANASRFADLHRNAKRRKTSHEPDLPRFDSSCSQDSTNSEQAPSKNYPVAVDTSGQSEIFTVPLDVPPIYDEKLTPLALFISDDVFQTHKPLIRSIEKLPNAPTLVSREFSRSLSSPQAGEASPGGKVMPQYDADITLSPRAGVLLATTQDSVQLYLPGHPVECIPGIKLNSPFRERVYHTCRKYDRLYIFIIHTVNPATARLSVFVDKRTSDALSSLGAFCDSLYEYSRVTAMNISSDPVVFTHWVESLARKHYISIPRIDVMGRPGGNPDMSRQLPFCPPGGGTIDETVEELFLRRSLGLNCYAACSVLHILSPILEGVDPASTTEISLGQVSIPINGRLLISLKSLFGKAYRAQMVPLVGERAFSRIHDDMLNRNGVN
ncbi:hypothetical protein FQN49_004422 [Arthroderma sp. PD_2]|nr:hypothetical protein FQN49_004422 [Arthroderma sp. PD_2]